MFVFVGLAANVKPKPVGATIEKIIGGTAYALEVEVSIEGHENVQMTINVENLPDLGDEITVYTYVGKVGATAEKAKEAARDSDIHLHPYAWVALVLGISVFCFGLIYLGNGGPKACP